MADTKCVLITVSGTDSENEKLSLSLRGELMEEGELWYLRYEEFNPDDLSHTQTLIQCEKKRVTIIRSGTLMSTIVYDPQETFVGDYETPYGNLTLRVYTSQALIQRRGAVGRIRLAYQINFSSNHALSEQASMRTMDIRFRPCRSN